MSKLVLVSYLVIPALMAATGVNAQTATQHPPSAMAASSQAVAPDNAKSNKVDPSNHDAVADKQQNNATDIDLAKRIRQGIMADKSLSTYGHNVKVIAANGSVTLNGVVRTAEEKTRIAKNAASIAGAGNVVDELKVAPPK